MTRRRAARRSIKKRPYRTPQLKTHGNLRALTTAKGSNQTDSGSNPKTRTTGGP